MNQNDLNPLDAFERDLIRSEREERELEALWRMTRTERVTLLLAGGMTRRQLAAWRGRRPAEVPQPERIRAAQDEALWRMTRKERVAAMEAGRLTQYQLFAWSNRRPYEVPLIDGELAWIVYRTADWIEAVERRPPIGEIPPCDNTGKPMLDCDCDCDCDSDGCSAGRGKAMDRIRADGVL